ncbi:hypothetical protein BDV96DRAFT_324169 [Lophiotrema nucula]|uniref:Uncharacterized protein n=1 Tax=Lophiotrema nucula TaxID=690887 RepID=A0A6A5ZMK1_9PLEO|nr:hypothetical protein BDV96DRAFT_324169 [Lophiotrema nucula]
MGTVGRMHSVFASHNLQQALLRPIPWNLGAAFHPVRTYRWADSGTISFVEHVESFVRVCLFHVAIQLAIGSGPPVSRYRVPGVESLVGITLSCRSWPWLGRSGSVARRFCSQIPSHRLSVTVQPGSDERLMVTSPSVVSRRDICSVHYPTAKLRVLTAIAPR